jgi:hypothetical protein
MQGPERTGWSDNITPPPSRARVKLIPQKAKFLWVFTPALDLIDELRSLISKERQLLIERKNKNPQTLSPPWNEFDTSVLEHSTLLPSKLWTLYRIHLHHPPCVFLLGDGLAMSIYSTNIHFHSMKKSFISWITCCLQCHTNIGVSLKSFNPDESSALLLQVF